MTDGIAKRSWPRIIFALIATISVGTCHMILRSYFEPGDPVRLAVTGVLVLCFAWVIWEQVRTVQELDEFQRQVQFLALSIAYPLALIAMFAVGFFRAEGFLSGADPRDLPFLLILIYAIGLTIAWTKYK